ncbi:MAG TPA: hypothetical protein PKY59_13620 [Pyrinomonadaceae bacterium]|nr:hypothetical protein [Pyrinomonadaceae bacterium]
MGKRKKQIKKSNSSKRKTCLPTTNNILPETVSHNLAPAPNSLLVNLAQRPDFVGAMRWMLNGCLACGGVLAAFATNRDLGRLYVRTTYQIAAFIPREFIPPKTYIPGVMTLPLCLLIISIFTFIGYKMGSEPIKIEFEKGIRSRNEKLLEFAVILILCLIFVISRMQSDFPERTFIQTISDPFTVVFFIIILIGLFYYTFSPKRSVPYQIFILKSATTVAFVVFLLGLTVYYVGKSLFYALNL